MDESMSSDRVSCHLVKGRRFRARGYGLLAVLLSVLCLLEPRVTAAALGLMACIVAMWPVPSSSYETADLVMGKEAFQVIVAGQVRDEIAYNSRRVRPWWLGGTPAAGDCTLALSRKSARALSAARTAKRGAGVEAPHPNGVRGRRDASLDRDGHDD